MVKPNGTGKHSIAVVANPLYKAGHSCMADGFLYHHNQYLYAYATSQAVPYHYISLYFLLGLFSLLGGHHCFVQQVSECCITLLGFRYDPYHLNSDRFFPGRIKI